MTDVIIASVGQTAVGEHWELSLRDLAFQAIEAALKDAYGLFPQAIYVGNMLAPVISHQSHLGTLIADYAGLENVEAYTIEAGGASGGAALRQAYLAIASGAVDVALVVGVEKFTDQIGSSVESALSVPLDSDYEAIHGLTPTAQMALLMRRYMHEYGVKHEEFGCFPLVAHANGAGNPNAMYRKPIKAETYQKAGIVCDPLNLFDVAPEGDGAAALVLARRDLLPPADYPTPFVRISGSSMVCDTLALHDRRNPLEMSAIRVSVQQACRQAGILPQDVDFFELSDSASIMATLSLEAAGFAERGKGLMYCQSGACTLQGELPILTMGGMKARGNVGGATGVYQAVEAVLQLRGTAGQNQIPNAKLGLIQCVGGAASSVATHVLERIIE